MSLRQGRVCSRLFLHVYAPACFQWNWDRTVDRTDSSCDDERTLTLPLPKLPSAVPGSPAAQSRALCGAPASL